MKKITNTTLLLLCSIFAFGQMDQYDHKREVQSITDQWHKIVLPADIYGKVSDKLSDIRIYGMTTNSDTLEAPYLLKSLNETNERKDVSFKLINQSKNGKGYFFTYEVPTEEPINQIDLDFNNNNFDWRVKLEGSQDQKEWFTLTENYRILAIQSDQTGYEYTTLLFPSAKYRYFRLQVNSKDDPKLASAKIVLNKVKPGQFTDYPIRSMKTSENKPSKRTEIELEFAKPFFLSQLEFEVDDKVDYYRPVQIMYVSDSIVSEKGVRYQYKTLGSGILTSIEKNLLKFSARTVQKVRIYVSNQDNNPLKIISITPRGYLQELHARFADPATYFLTYGNTKARRPNYDIARFTNKVPKEMAALNLGPEIKIDTVAKKEVQPIFQNKAWLWGVMALVILLLGWFTLRMMREKNEG